MSDKFVRDYFDKINGLYEIKKEREKPITVNSILGQQLLNVFEKRILLWPPRDIRYSENGLDKKIMEDIANGMETVITRKDIETGIVELTVMFQSNLDAFEMYNLKVRQHNQRWMDNGKPTKVVNPITGDEHRVEDQFVDPAYINSSHTQLPDSIYRNVSSGPLASSRPQINRKAFVKTIYRVNIEDDNFILGYIVYDHHNEIVYYNELTHSDLSYLIRRSIQEIWGNPESINGTKYALNGISMLINGKKLHQCRKDNKMPSIAGAPNVLKNPATVEFAEAKQKATGTLSNHFAYTIPVALGFGILIAVFKAFIGWKDVVMGLPETYPIAETTLLTVFACVMLILIIISRFASRKMNRKSSEMEVVNRFI